MYNRGPDRQVARQEAARVAFATSAAHWARRVERSRLPGGGWAAERCTKTGTTAGTGWAGAAGDRSGSTRGRLKQRRWALVTARSTVGVAAAGWHVCVQKHVCSRNPHRITHITLITLFNASIHQLMSAAAAAGGAAGFWKMTASHSNSSLLTATTCRAPRCGELPIESSNRIASFQILEEPGLGINQATRPRARREKRRAEPADTHPRRPPGGPLNTYSRGRNQSLGRLPSPIGQ